MTSLTAIKLRITRAACGAERYIVRQAKHIKPYLITVLLGAAGMPVAMMMDGSEGGSPLRIAGVNLQGSILDLFMKVIEPKSMAFREDKLKNDKFNPVHLIFLARLLAYHGRVDEVKAKDCAQREVYRLSPKKVENAPPEPAYSDELKDLSRNIVKVIEENLSALVRARAGQKVVDMLDDFAFKTGMKNTSGSGWSVICGITYNEYSKAFVELLEQKVRDLYGQ